MMAEALLKELQSVLGIALGGEQQDQVSKAINSVSASS